MEREVSDMGESLLDVCLYGELEDALEGVNSIFRFSKNYAKACIENVWLIRFVHNYDNKFSRQCLKLRFKVELIGSNIESYKAHQISINPIYKSQNLTNSNQT